MGQIMEKPAEAGELTEAQAQQGGQYLTFYLQGEMFGLNILPIKEIIEYGKVTSVPMVPEYVRGVINLRGNVVPVIDLPVRFGWASSPPNKRTCIVIVEVESDQERLDIGIVIDSVSEVLDIEAANIGAAPSFGAKIRTDFIAGMGRVGEDFIVLLNVNKVLSVDELSQLGDVPGADLGGEDA
ncbi:chemotaxis protein CheW [Motiliproteus sp. SC1-56]|uniref:chemotaxis protein CheW n=1 Tax=Motiliproteus sp. SC1-56 TaxID=2799565 RepID=UPI001F5D6D7C|nr:chemotaxis protein CheW [Motiliproteus sp. SC1-56]